MNKANIKFSKVISPQKHVYVYKYHLHLQKDKIYISLSYYILPYSMFQQSSIFLQRGS